MKWLLIAVSIVFTLVDSVYSGTFVEDFSDRNLDEWRIAGHPKPVFPDRVRVEDGYLVMDAPPPLLAGQFHGYTHMELRTGDWEYWDSYSLTCRIRFERNRGEFGGDFHVEVRRGSGRFGVAAWQKMGIYPASQRIQVTTVPPNAKDDRVAGIKGMIRRQTLKGRDLRGPIEVGQWIPIKVVAEKDRFEFHFDGNFVTQYVDDTAVRGTVSFIAHGGLAVHLDDITITGVGVPQSIDHKSRLVTTWAEVKNSLRK